MSRAEVQSFKVHLTSASGVPAAIRENVHARRKQPPARSGFGRHSVPVPRTRVEAGLDAALDVRALGLSLLGRLRPVDLGLL